MKKLAKLLIIILVIVNFQLSIVNSVFAADVRLGPITGLGVWQKNLTSVLDTGSAFEKFSSTVLGTLTALGGLFVFLQLVLGALSWITAAGDKANLEKARSQITNAFVGLVIIIAAWSIIFLIGGILGLDILNPRNLIKNLDPNYTAPTKCPNGWIYNDAKRQCCISANTCYTPTP